MTNAEARFNKSHIRKVDACLAVTCHLHFWQNDRDFLRATVVTRGWNGYRNKSQHRKSTLEKKILPPFQQGFEPATFQSRVRCSNHWAIPAPRHVWSDCHLLRQSSGGHGWLLPPPLSSWRFSPDWAIQRSWFARVNALCNLSRKKSRKKSREVAAHFRADFWAGVASRCV